MNNTPTNIQTEVNVDISSTETPLSTHLYEVINDMSTTTHFNDDKPRKNSMTIQCDTSIGNTIPVIHDGKSIAPILNVDDSEYETPRIKRFI